ncbi:hypothetical protein C8R44DRAFT_890100 [Mycena epipterygia]|nr:hypothetical protein C8R44DRAFT_890100 [Mycena epipterygia]
MATRSSHPRTTSPVAASPDDESPEQQQGSGVIQVVHTDDAASKLSDASAAAASIATQPTLACGAAPICPRLCNKCGLFERAHSRPRSEQFSPKCGPLVTPA